MRFQPVEELFPASLPRAPCPFVSSALDTLRDTQPSASVGAVAVALLGPPRADIVS